MPHIAAEWVDIQTLGGLDDPWMSFWSVDVELESLKETEVGRVSRWISSPTAAGKRKKKRPNVGRYKKHHYPNITHR
jgi:hypothetical protein